MVEVKGFFDETTFTVTYVVYDPNSKDAVIIDPVLDYDPAASRLDTHSADEVTHFVKEKNLKIHYLLETHAHADHLSASQVFKTIFPQAKLAIGENIKKVQGVFKDVFNLEDDFKADGSQFDQLFQDGEKIIAGTLTIETIFTPGHTPACASYLIGDAVFTGDALFMPDYGTGRCDFPAGDAEALYHSVHGRLYSLPDSTRVFVGHDYMPNGREAKWESTVGEQKKSNIQLRAETEKSEFVDFRTSRDKTLNAPKLLLPSVQFNIRAGHLPEPENNGKRYFKLPLRGSLVD